MVKLAKYLPHHGVRPSVLTVANPSVPLRDESLLDDVPDDIEIARARTFEPSYATKQAAWKAEASGHTSPRRVLAGMAKQMLFPDPQVLWQPAAQATLLARLAERRDDVILVSGPPFSQFLMAPLARVAGVGVVLDYRDEWSTLRTSYEMTRSAVARALGDPLEAALLRRHMLSSRPPTSFGPTCSRVFPSSTRVASSRSPMATIRTTSLRTCRIRRTTASSLLTQARSST